jgi:hypothetical protein
MFKIITATAIALTAFAAPAFADQVLVDQQHKNFKVCAIANGLVLAELKGKGLEVDVVVNTAPAYIAKVQTANVSILLMCEEGHQIVTLVKN